MMLRRRAAALGAAVGGARGGMTFIELLFVLMILAVLVAVTAPRFNTTLDRLQTEHVAFDTMQLLRYAQAVAVARRRTVTVSLDEEQRRLRLTVEQEGRRVPLDDRRARGPSLPRSLRVAILRSELGGTGGGADAGIDFYPDGTSQPMMITITDQGGTAYRIAVEETTGRVALRSSAG